VAVYQHRPRLRCEELFADLAVRLDYAPNVQVVYEANLAFLVLSRSRATADRLARAAIGYCQGRPEVRAAALSRGGRGDQPTREPGERTPGSEIRDSAGA